MLKDLLRYCFSKLGYQILPTEKYIFSDPHIFGKAKNLKERFKDVISDPINLLIERVPEAGYLDSRKNVFLHNGIKVPTKGKYAYYDNFTDILIFNRGVHEPLEEFCFQEVLKKIDINKPIMIELGSYWAHYSMWFMKTFECGKSFMIEPDLQNLNSGKYNFHMNSLTGEFIQSEVRKGKLELDSFLQENEISSLEILHCDIQGFEVEMLNCADKALKHKNVNYFFISTHSESIHHEVCDILVKNEYVIEVSSNFDDHTTSFDGFVLASSPNIKRVFHNFNPMGRLDILQASPEEILDSLQDIK